MVVLTDTGIGNIPDRLREAMYLTHGAIRGELQLVVTDGENPETAATKVYGIVIKQLENLEKKINSKTQSSELEKLENEYLKFKRFGERLEKGQYRDMLEHIYGGLYIEKKEAERSRKRMAEIWKIRGDEQDSLLDDMIKKCTHD